jgi:hypothetical protein
MSNLLVQNQMTWRNKFACLIVEKTMCSVFIFSKGDDKLIFSISGDDPLPAYLETILTTLSGRQINLLAQKYS